MIDWFVVLIPVVLLPLFLFFVFSGCALDQSGLLENVAYVSLTYSGGLTESAGSAPDVHSIDWELITQLDTGNETKDFKRGVASQDAIDPNGETITWGIPSESDGEIICKCKVVAASNPPFTDSITVVNLGLTKNKDKGESGPEFHLSRVDSGFALT